MENEFITTIDQMKKEKSNIIIYILVNDNENANKNKIIKKKEADKINALKEEKSKKIILKIILK